MRHSNRAELLL